MRFRFTLPRKGMETIAKFLSLCLTILFRFTLPRKGTETRFINDTSFNPFAEVSIYSSPQGDGNNVPIHQRGIGIHEGFDLLFPARGRKHGDLGNVQPDRDHIVSIYSSPQGDGNSSSTGTTRHVRTGFDLLFPARGRKPWDICTRLLVQPNKAIATLSMISIPALY